MVRLRPEYGEYDRLADPANYCWMDLWDHIYEKPKSSSGIPGTLFYRLAVGFDHQAFILLVKIKLFRREADQGYRKVSIRVEGNRIVQLKKTFGKLPTN